MLWTSMKARSWRYSGRINTRMTFEGIAFVSRTRWAGLVAGILMTVLGQAEAATINAKSVSLPDVSSAIASAHDGDTVVVPPGTASWTSTLTIAKGIMLEGAGNDKTVILDEVPREESREQPARRSQPEGPKQQSPERPGGAVSAQPMAPPGQARRKVGSSRGLMKIQLTPSQSFRLTGFTFRYGSSTMRVTDALLHIDGTCPSVRVDHCHFDQLYRVGILFQGWIYGVVDHCRWDGRANAGTVQAMVVNNGATWGGGANNYGDGSWATPTDFGSQKFLFIEDNIFNNLGTVQTTPMIDCQDGGRYVSRHNQFFNCVMMSGHGTESGGRHRGQRAIEFYNNAATVTIPQSIGLTRSGTILYHDNSWTGPVVPRIPLVVFREDWPFPTFDGANGHNSWDVNDTEGNGTNVPGHRPHLYASGKHTGANASSGTLVSAGAGWQPNQWIGYMLTNTTQTTPKGTHHCSRILSNTNDTIVYNTKTPDGQPKTFNSGDEFAIYRLLITLDQPGRGVCDLLAGNPPFNKAGTGGTNWPHQALEPIYAWSNAVNGAPVKVTSTYPTLQENRDYYNQATSFNGTVGVGVGTLANRPKTCTPGVGYWATDQGEWDSAHDGPDGQLYVCTAPNTWSLYYKPYTYPHPLVSGSPPPRSNKAGRQSMGD